MSRKQPQVRSFPPFQATPSERLHLQAMLPETCASASAQSASAREAVLTAKPVSKDSPTTAPQPDPTLYDVEEHKGNAVGAFTWMQTMPRVHLPIGTIYGHCFLRKISIIARQLIGLLGNVSSFDGPHRANGHASRRRTECQKRVFMMERYCPLTTRVESVLWPSLKRLRSNMG